MASPLAPGRCGRCCCWFLSWIAASSGLYTIPGSAGVAVKPVVETAMADVDSLEQITDTHFAPIPDDSTGGVLLAMLSGTED